MKPTKHLLLCAALLLPALVQNSQAKLDDQVYERVVASQPAIGDIVFTRIGGPIFTRVAATTQSWTSHVGIIVDYRDGEWIVAESRIPLVGKTTLHRFLDRSKDQRFAIMRLKAAPSLEQRYALLRFADSQMGKLYSLGFDLNGQGTFCSKFVHDAVLESTHQSIGEVETFDQLLHRNPDSPLWFWRTWFLGSIPWQRTTITPASELDSPLLNLVAKNNA
jgi:hypothetical protein